MVQKQVDNANIKQIAQEKKTLNDPKQNRMVL